MIKRLVPRFLVLALIISACGGDGDSTTEATTAATAGEVTTAATSAAPTTVVVDLAQDGTLAEVQARGSLRCGVSTSAIGFAEPQDDGSYKGFDADYCPGCDCGCPR